MMDKQKVYIEYQFKDGPYGGANQFLKSLRDFFVANECYADCREDADFILINHTNISMDTLQYKREHPEKIIIHRMDGPVSKHRKWSKILDKQSFFLDKLICDGTIFQSKWTKESCKETGYRETGLTTIIHNAPDPLLFNRENIRKEKDCNNGKIKLIATSWSDNWNKGFDILKYLDDNLDFHKYDFTFVGKSPIDFKNIHHVAPLGSKELAGQLKQHDIFIAVSKSESCSNSLLEAMNCGLAVVARKSGCYPEIVGQGGIICETIEQFPEMIDKVAENIGKYQENVPFFERKKAGEAYYAFMQEVKEAVDKGTLRAKEIHTFSILRWKAYCLAVKVYQKCFRIMERIYHK